MTVEAVAGARGRLCCAGLLLEDVDPDLRGALAPRAQTLVDFLPAV